MSGNDMRQVRPADHKSQADIRSEWDQIALLRHRQMALGSDLSFEHVTLPSVLELLSVCNLEKALDIGCGTGNLTKELVALSKSVVAVDVSPKSVEIAQRVCKGNSNVSFHVGSIEEFEQRWEGPKFTVAIANMVLMDCLSIESFLGATANLVAPQGYFIATLTHPFFWPRYRGYEDSEWFEYHKEMVLEAPFQISSEMTDYITTHVHRPLSTYVNSLRDAGFWTDRVLEPFPDHEIQSEYPEPWGFPRFIALRLKRE